MTAVISARRSTGLDQVEADLNGYLDEYSSSGYAKSLLYLPRHPRKALAAFDQVHLLPTIEVDPTSGVEGLAVRRELSRGRVRLHTPLHAVSAAITIPDDIAEYTAGASMQTLRRKLRDAQKRGITWEPVTDPAMRCALVEMADEHERSNPIERYKAENPHNADLVDYRLWMVARDRDGRPLMLSVTPVDRGVAALRYFRTLVANDDASVARYFLTNALVEELHRQGARSLVDTMPSMHLASGLRHFQRMVGFRLVRLEFPDER